MKTRIIIISLIAATFIVGLVAIYFFVYNKPHTNYLKVSPDLEINAEDLYNAFIDDEKAASAAFIGKLILIEGTIGYIEEHETLVIIGFIFQEGLFGNEGVRCAMLKDQHLHIDSIKLGQTITIKGLCTGFNGHDVILEHCSLVI